jgi:hypothetical protein
MKTHDIVADVIREEIRENVLEAMKNLKFDYTKMAKNIFTEMGKILPKMIAKNIGEEQDWVYESGLLDIIGNKIATKVKNMPW